MLEWILIIVGFGMACWFIDSLRDNIKADEQKRIDGICNRYEKEIEELRSQLLKEKEECGRLMYVEECLTELVNMERNEKEELLKRIGTGT